MCQALTLKGKIINEQGEPIQGATITLKRPPTPNTQPQTPNSALSSDANGEFSIANLHLGDTVIITAVGYERYTFIYDHSYARYPLTTIWLKRRISQLGEVVVNTGYQQLPKERATGSFTTITSQEFNLQVGTTVLDRLPAIANGFTYDRRTTSPGFSLRGLSTIQGERGPLIVVDNFPYSGDITNINPAEVEAITFLKDAAAASIWGAKAGNGVVVITTKKGRFNQPLSLTWQNNLTITAKPDLFTLPQMTATDFIEVEQFLFAKNHYNSQLTSAQRPPLSPVVELLLQRAGGTLAQADLDNRLVTLRQRDWRTDLDRWFYQPAVNQQYALSLQTGSRSFATRFSIGGDINVSDLAATYRRLNLHWQNSFRVGNRLQFEAAVSYTGSRNRNGRPAFGSFTTANGALPPYTEIVGPAGEALPVIKNYRLRYTDTAGAGRLLDWNYYPLTDYQHTAATTSLSDILVNGGLQYTIHPGLLFNLTYQYEKQAVAGKTVTGAESYAARDLVNLFTQLNRATGALTYRVPPGAILDLSHTDLVAHKARAQLSWNRDVRNLRFAAIGGAETSQAALNSSAARTYGYDVATLSFAQVDYTVRHPLFTGGTNFIPAANSISSRTDRFVSFFANTALTFLDRYTLSASARRDASNLFGVATNEKWTPLWSAGAAWEISKEGFYRSRFLPYLRLRTTWGVSGNVDQSRSALTRITYASASPYTLQPYATISAFANPELRWERVRTINIGLDLRAAGNRLVLAVDVFQKEAFDLFGLAQVDPTAGIGGTVTKNAAAMKGRGLDLELTTQNTTGGLRWSTTWNLNHYTDKITKTYIATQLGRSYVGTTTPGITILEGKPVYSIFAYHWEGLDPQTGDPLGLLNGQTSKDYNALTGAQTLVTDLRYMGPAMPTTYGSLGNTLAWKNLSLTAQLVYKWGYVVRRDALSYTALFGSRAGHPDYAGRWKKPGDEQHTNVPSLVYPAVSARDAFYQGAAVHVTKGDHLRLQFLRLSYDWTAKKQTGPKAIRFFLVGNNLALLWKATREPIDPDFPVAAVRPGPSLSAGVNLNF
jgi:TonB-linked SusC/RagA family outer membrane protein